MENSLENKAKLFAQYWGQAVQRYGNNFYTKVVNSFIDDSLLVGDYLLLKPLSSITNEDAFELADMLGVGKSNNPIEYVKEILHTAYINNDLWALNLTLVDYLRSKGYALPWMNLSVEKQIEYGWIKLI